MKRTLLSGRRKTSELGPLNPKNKTPTLFDHTTKIQQKLLKLKQQINEKKKNQSQQSNTNSNLNKSQSKMKVTTGAKVVLVEVDQQLSGFLKDIGMQNYEKVLAENGIDCLEVLRQIKQKDLEEIGVMKGHALKIMVSLRKMLESRDKANRKQLSSAETAQNTSKINSKYNKNPQPSKPQRSKQQQPTKIDHPKNQPLEIVIQTDQGFSTQQQLPKRRYFCLYCYQVSAIQFCSEDCEELYNKMFQKYQRNLQKTQQLFSGKVQTMPLRPEQQNQQNQFVTDLGFLDFQPQSQYAKYNVSSSDQDLDEKTYKQALDLIKLTINQTKQQQTWQTYQQNDEKQKQLDSMPGKQQ